MDWDLVICGHVFSLKHAAGDFFSSITNYSFKTASSLASHKELHLWLETFSNLLNVVQSLLFANLLPSSQSIS